MSDYTKELLKHLSYVGLASRRLMAVGPTAKKAPTQQLVLDILAGEEGITSGVLAEILDIRPSSLTEILNKLESRGEIERREDPQDKRVKRLYITETGRGKIDQAQPKDRSAEFFSGLTAEEIQTLDQLLNKIIAGWKEDFGGRSEFSNDPFEAIQALKALRKQMDPKMTDFSQLSAAERREIKRAWKEQMRHQFGRRSFGPNFGPDPLDPNQTCEKGPHHVPHPQEHDWENW